MGVSGSCSRFRPLSPANRFSRHQPPRAVREPLSLARSFGGIPLVLGYQAQCEQLPAHLDVDWETGTWSSCPKPSNLHMCDSNVEDTKDHTKESTHNMHRAPSDSLECRISVIHSLLVQSTSTLPVIYSQPAWSASSFCTLFFVVP